MTGIHKHIHRSIPIAPLVVFRALFGLIMLVSIIRFAVRGWIEQLYVEPTFFFTYPGFDWIRPFGEQGMYATFALMGLSCIGIMLGWKYRLSAIVFFLSFTYVELIDKTNYLNHYYFVSIIAFLLILAPANRAFSLDAHYDASIRRTLVPAWTINMFKLQLGLVYFFAGLAKINPDWLVHGMPLKIWLAGKSNTPVIGWLFNYQWTAILFSWAGMLYDLIVPFLLLSKRTRIAAYGLVIAFHVMTAALFNIGMFPYIMMLSTLIFFPAAFHQRIIDNVTKLFNTSNQKPGRVVRAHPSIGIASKVALAVVAIHFIVQIALPFRSSLTSGNLYWNEEGYRFSWRVMLMEKAGYAQFTVWDKSSGAKTIVDNAEFLTPYQEKMMSTQPDMLLQFSHFLADEYKRRGFDDPGVTADTRVSLNGRPGLAILHPSVDLSEKEYIFGSNDWITALNKNND